MEVYDLLLIMLLFFLPNYLSIIMFHFYNKPEKKNYIYREEDPYGEENWDD